MFATKKIWGEIITDFGVCCRLTLILSCTMNFRSYPHDTQECSMKIESCKCFCVNYSRLVLSKSINFIFFECVGTFLFESKCRTRRPNWCSSGLGTCHWSSTISNFPNSTWRKMLPVTAPSGIQQVIYWAISCVML